MYRVNAHARQKRNKTRQSGRKKARSIQSIQLDVAIPSAFLVPTFVPTSQVQIAPTTPRAKRSSALVSLTASIMSPLRVVYSFKRKALMSGSVIFAGVVQLQIGGVVNSLKPSSKPVIFLSGIKVFSVVHKKSRCEVVLGIGLFSNF